MLPPSSSPSAATSATTSAAPTVPSLGTTADAHTSGLVLRSPDAVWQAATSLRPLRSTYRLGDLLVLHGFLKPEALHEALQQQLSQPGRRLLGQVLLERGDIQAVHLQMALASQAGMPLVDCRAFKPDDEALALVPHTTARRDRVLPLLRRGGTLVVAMDDPWCRTTLDELGFVTNLRVAPVMALPGTLTLAQTEAYLSLKLRRQGSGEATDVHQLAAVLAGEIPSQSEVLGPASQEVISESSSTLVKLVNTVIADAIERKASDIHIESDGPHSAVRVRFRIDGLLVPYLELPAHYRSALVARLKIMSDLDIAERRKPQDGKIDFSRFGDLPMELRVVTVPTAHGVEQVVLRLLSGARPLPIDGIGLSPANLVTLKERIHKPYGLILICGPTGCGKTTTLHSVLRELNQGGTKIWTAEDPIEITQPGLCQVQVNARIGWTFAAAMRTFLRADPDVIMIGEMRDAETANIAIEASLTGHLVLSTLHTNSAAESITRLLEIGLDPFNFSDSLLAVLAQRLVRRVCTHCGERRAATPEELEAMAHEYLRSGRATGAEALQAVQNAWRQRHGDAQGTLWLRHRGPGCDHCHHHGYQGRLGVHELLVADDAVRRLIRHRASAAEILQTALAGGMHTLRQDGIEKVLQGLTDLSEVMAASNG